MIYDSHLKSISDTSQNNSPINSLTTTQAFWHGSVETSTDTLVPVVETAHANHYDSVDSTKANTFNRSLADESNKDCVQDYLPLIDSMCRSTDTRRILPKVHNSSNNSNKVKAWSTSDSNNTNSIDESIIQQLENQRMESTIENNIVTQNSTNDVPLYRRRRNSSNSRQPIIDNTNGLPNRTNNNGR